MLVVDDEVPNSWSRNQASKSEEVRNVVDLLAPLGV